MSDLFKNKYRISSARLQTWDYASEGMYFVTICTAERECFFGKIIKTPDAANDSTFVETRCIASLQPAANPNTLNESNKMQLSEIGKIAASEWVKTIQLRPDMNLELGEYVVMPNHVHGIIIIGENSYNSSNGRHYGRDAMHRVSTKRETTSIANFNGNKPQNKFGPQSKNVGSIMRGYKSAVSTWARKKNVPFAWQALFHDHIIRSAAEHERIADYIINNPNNWAEDEFYKMQ